MPTILRKTKKVHRNDICPCGSGKKFKNCCISNPKADANIFIYHPKQIKPIIDMINSIFEYFKTDRSWNGGVKLFTRYGRNKAFQRKIQLQGETPANFDMLHYQLWKLTGKSESELKKILSVPIDTRKAAPLEPLDTNDTLQAEKPATMSVQEATKFRLREEFPFLNSKDCPDAFKVLVADMLTAHDNYVNAHTDLFNITSTDEAFAAADKLIDNYLENRSIWDELKHYQSTGKILGKHPYFEEENRRKKLIKMSVPDLIKLRENLEMNIWRNKKKLEDDPKPHLLKQREKRIDEYEYDLKIVKGLLKLD